MRHDKEVIQKLKPILQSDPKILDRGSKQLERDQKALEKIFDNLTTKVTPPELEEIHQAYHDTEPTAPPRNDDTSSLPPNEKATSLYPSLSKPIPSFVVMNGIGQEEICACPFFYRRNSQRGRCNNSTTYKCWSRLTYPIKQTKVLKKAIPEFTKNLKQFSSMLEGVLRMSGAVSSSPFTSSSSLQPTPPPKKTPPVTLCQCSICSHFNLYLR